MTNLAAGRICRKVRKVMTRPMPVATGSTKHADADLTPVD